MSHQIVKLGPDQTSRDVRRELKNALLRGTSAASAEGAQAVRDGGSRLTLLDAATLAVKHGCVAESALPQEEVQTES